MVNDGEKISRLLAEIASVHLPEIDMGLNRMHALLALLGNPHKKLPPVVHIAGTNGKGSTAAFIKSVLENAGVRVHRYTSPHLVRFNERIELAGTIVDNTALHHALERVSAAVKMQPATFFEATTAAAFLCFAEHAADILLLEVGLGGRLDATNVIEKSLLSIITPIHYDHQEYLGSTLTQIAHEKAGIMKHDGTCISAPQEAEVTAELIRVAESRRAKLSVCGKDWHYEINGQGIMVESMGQCFLIDKIGLLGEHQRENAATAIAAASALMHHFPITQDHIKKGIAHASWPARLQRLQRGDLVDALPHARITLDGGHNLHAAQALSHWLASIAERKYLWLGMRRTKDAENFIAHIARQVHGIFLLPIEGCLDSFTTKELALIAKDVCPTGCKIVECASVSEAVDHQRRCDENATILIAGSLYLAGNILKNNG